MQSTSIEKSIQKSRRNWKFRLWLNKQWNAVQMLGATMDWSFCNSNSCWMRNQPEILRGWHSKQLLRRIQSKLIFNDERRQVNDDANAHFNLILFVNLPAEWTEEKAKRQEQTDPRNRTLWLRRNRRRVFAALSFIVDSLKPTRGGFH